MNPPGERSSADRSRSVRTLQTDFLLLAGIALQPANAYRIVETARSLSGAGGRSTLFRRLDVLRDTGLLRADEGENSGGNRPRRLLYLTPLGTDFVTAEALNALETAPLDSTLFGLAVTLIPVIARAPGLADVIVCTLRSRLTEVRQQLANLEEAPYRDAALTEPWASIGARRAEAHLRADLLWLEEFLRDLFMPRGRGPRPGR